MAGIAIYDIETGPLPLENIEAFLPKREAPTNYGEEAAAKYVARHRKKDIEKAALSAMTGKVLAIGYLHPDDQLEILECDADEATLLRAFWAYFTRDVIHQRIHTFGFNNLDFDLPFLLTRSQTLDVLETVPPEVLNYHKFRYYSDHHHDIRNLLFGELAKASLGTVANFFGTKHQKSGQGKDFAELWATNKQAAREYCANDIRVTEDVVRKVWQLN